MSQTFLLIEADFYTDLAAALAEGAMAAISAAGAQYERVSVPGALEIPGAIAMAAASSRNYAGFVALGCVIRGETSHYDTVCNESARGIMQLTVEGLLPIGNGIITVENREQAWARANMADKDKGGDAARAALAMAALKKEYM